MTFLKRGIALRISLFIGVLVLLISAGFGILAYYQGSATASKQVEEALVMQAGEAAEYLQTRLEVQLTALEAIAARPELTSMDWAQQQPVLQAELERLEDYLALGVVSPNGVALYADGSTANLGDRDYVIQALQGHSVVSNLLVSRVTNSLVLMYAVPIKDNGRTVGVLIGRRDGASLNEITDRLGFGENGWAVILNSDGTLFAHPNREYVMDQTNVFTDSGSLADAGTAIQELGVGNAGVIRYNLDGARRWMALTPVESTGWTIGVGALEADVLRDVHALRNFFGFASVAFLAVGVLGAVAVGRQVSVPLSRVQTVIEAAAAGDLTRMAQVRSKDEIGTVVQAVNTTMESMREMLGLITQSTAELANTSSRLAAASQQVSASVEEVASTTNEFSGTLDSLNTNAQQMKETVQGVAREADEGTKAIADIVRQMQLLRDSTHSLASDVSSLGGLSEQIGNIVHTIGAIADQTNLLALNAAIEAARAGEHGRGFAVVAEEVRKLAEESATAAKSIEQLIGRIQSGIGGIVSAMDAGTQQTETALQNVHHSSQILGEILHSVEEIQRQVAGFTAGLEQINLGGHEIASASQEQAASMQEIASSAQELMAMGARLQELVERFKLKAE